MKPRMDGMPTWNWLMCNMNGVFEQALLWRREIIRFPIWDGEKEREREGEREIAEIPGLMQLHWKTFGLLKYFRAKQIMREAARRGVKEKGYLTTVKKSVILKHSEPMLGSPCSLMAVNWYTSPWTVIATIPLSWMEMDYPMRARQYMLCLSSVRLMITFELSYSSEEITAKPDRVNNMIWFGHYFIGVLIAVLLLSIKESD